MRFKGVEFLFGQTTGYWFFCNLFFGNWLLDRRRRFYFALKLLCRFLRLRLLLGFRLGLFHRFIRILLSGYWSTGHLCSIGVDLTPDLFSPGIKVCALVFAERISYDSGRIAMLGKFVQRVGLRV